MLRLELGPLQVAHPPVARRPRVRPLGHRGRPTSATSAPPPASPPRATTRTTSGPGTSSSRTPTAAAQVRGRLRAGRRPGAVAARRTWPATRGSARSRSSAARCSARARSMAASRATRTSGRRSTTRAPTSSCRRTITSTSASRRRTPDGTSDTQRGIRQFTVGTGGYFLYHVRGDQAAERGAPEQARTACCGSSCTPTPTTGSSTPVAGSTYTRRGKQRLPLTPSAASRRTEGRIRQTSRSTEA